MTVLKNSVAIYHRESMKYKIHAKLKFCAQLQRSCWIFTGVEGYSADTAPRVPTLKLSI